jgi:hypothetical protein
MSSFCSLACIESPEDDSQSIDAAAVAATMPSLDLFSKF